MASSRYNLRARAVPSNASPTKADFQVAQVLMSLRSWTSPVVAPPPRREQPARACRDSTKAQQSFSAARTQRSWPTSTIAERVKARHAAASEF